MDRFAPYFVAWAHHGVESFSAISRRASTREHSSQRVNGATLRQLAELGPGVIDFGVPPRVPDVFRPTCHIFYAMRVVDIVDDLPKWSGHKGKSTLLSDGQTS